MSEILRIMKAESKRKKAIDDKLVLVKTQLVSELDSWRRARLARMTKADWICEYRYWQEKLAEKSDSETTNPGTIWTQTTIKEFLEKTHKEWDPLLASSSKEAVKNMVRTLIEYCGTFIGAPEVDDRYFD